MSVRLNMSACSYCDAPARYYVPADVAAGYRPEGDRLGNYLLPSTYACRRHLSALVELATLYMQGRQAYHDNRDTSRIEITVLPAFLTAETTTL